MARHSKTPALAADWLSRRGPGYPLVISSRARLARNLEGLPFPCAADEEDLERARGVVLEAVSRRVAGAADWDVSFAEELSREQLGILAEEHITGLRFGDRPAGRAVAVAWKDGRSVTVNEEDHLRAQAVLPGAQLVKAWKLVDALDTLIEGDVQYGYDQELGYLTSCPSNVGTGLRVSAMLHLPALVITGEIARTISALGKAGLYVRGLYGEGSGVAGNLFQISNRRTLGITEAEIVSNLDSLMRQVMDNERTARKMLLREDSLAASDRVYRALGVVERARKMGFFEALELLSLVRLGLDLEILPLDEFNMAEVVVGLCPNHMRGELAVDAEEEDLDVERAPRLRRYIGL